MLKRKTLALVSTGVLAAALSFGAFAGGPTVEQTAPAEASGFTLGMTDFVLTGASTYAAMFGYVNEAFLADIGAGYTSATNTTSTNTAEKGTIRADLGMRHSIAQSLFATFGAMGSYGWKGNTTANETNPYSIGAFVGMDYQPLTHLLLSFKISPYTYSVNVLKVKSNSVFTAGSLGASYIFTE